MSEHQISLNKETDMAVVRLDQINDHYYKLFNLNVPKDLVNNIKKAIVSQDLVWIIDNDGKLYEYKFSGTMSPCYCKLFDTREINEPILDIVGNDNHLFLTTKSQMYGLGVCFMIY